MIALLWAKYWKIIVAVGAAVVIFSIFAFLIQAYGDAREKAGRAAADLEWSQKLGEAQARVSRAERELNAVRIERDQARAERDEARRRRLVQVTQEISNAPNFEARYAAYLSHRVSLREQRSDRLARVRADYLSSVAPD